MQRVTKHVSELYACALRGATGPGGSAWARLFERPRRFQARSRVMRLRIIGTRSCANQRSHRGASDRPALTMRCYSVHKAVAPVANRPDGRSVRRYSDAATNEPSRHVLRLTSVCDQFPCLSRTFVAEARRSEPCFRKQSSINCVWWPCLDKSARGCSD